MAETTTPSAGELEEMFDLDLTPGGKEDPITVVQEKPKEAVTCSRYMAHPMAPKERFRCNREAKVNIDLGAKPCGDVMDKNLCMECWTLISTTPGFTWKCNWPSPGCGLSYVVMDAVTAWRKL